MSEDNILEGSGFLVMCVECQLWARLEFYEGFVHDCGGDTGSMSIVCSNCNKEFTAP